MSEPTTAKPIGEDRLCANRRHHCDTPAILVTMMDQIGEGTLLGVSGGRYIVRDSQTLRLPAGCGYAVDVRYNHGEDLYEVSRVYVRDGLTHVKGTRTRIYCDQLAETVWDASCFRNVPFGEDENAPLV
ncbi:MAG: hypothetical protein JJU00_14790 [Opitutales bacterium]|nr:hypothetical protein [Opitutales bacterium]